MIPRFGDPALEVFRSDAASVYDTDRRVAKSMRAGRTRTERVTVEEPGTRSRSYFVTVRPQGGSRYQEREYTLRVGE